MNLKKARIIFLKEMLETLRDKRTLFIMILGPVLVYPLLIIVTAQMQVYQETRTRKISIPVEVLGADIAPELVSMLEESENLEVISALDEQRKRPAPEISEGMSIRIIISSQEGKPRGYGNWLTSQGFFKSIFDKKTAPGLIRITTVHDAADFYSVRGKEIIDSILFNYSRRMIEKDIVSLARGESFQYPLIKSEFDVSTPIRRGGHILGNVLPIILVMMTIAGAMHPAIDTTAGEKERGTIETILTVPASMTEIVLGKFLSVLVISFGTGLLNLAGMAVTFGHFLFIPEAAIDFSIPANALLLIFVFLVPLAFLFSSLMMAVATYARTFKEAQNYVSILYIICIFPALLSTTQGFELSGFMTIMPVANLSLLFKELMQQKFVLNHILVVFLSTSVYAAGALRLTVRLFHNENVLFASERPFSLFVRRRLLTGQERPTPAEGLFLTAITFILFFTLGSLLQTRDIVSGMIATQIGIILVPAFVFAWYLKVDLRKTFNLRLPSIPHGISALLLGFAFIPIALGIDQIQTRIYDTSGIVEDFTGESVLSGMGLPMRLFVLAFLPAVCEEMLFRGFILSAFTGRMNAWKAIVLTGALFGFFHVMVWILRAVPAAHIVLGIVLSYLVYRSRSVLTGILMHFVYNGTIAVSMGSTWGNLLSGQNGTPVWMVLTAGIMFFAGVALIFLPSRGTSSFDRR